jgi:hypothetical protein
LKLLLDEQQSRRLAEVLRSEGHDVVAVTERRELRGQSDDVILAAAVSERRAVITENIGDFAVLHRRAIDEGRTHFGIALASRERFPRRRRSRAQLLAALRSLLRANPSVDALRDQLIWLG